MKKIAVQGEQIYAEVLDTVRAVIVVMDTDGRIVLFNRAAEELTGYLYKEVEGRFMWDLFILPEEIDGVQEVFKKLSSGDYPNSHTNYWLTKAKQHRLIEWSNTAIVDQDGKIAFVIGTGIDITDKIEAQKEVEQYQKNLEQTVAQRTAELNRINKQLDKMARIDTTTGIYNRRHFNERLEAEWRRSRRAKEPLALLMCDVDYFKKYNDAYGHVAGDVCLKEIATTLDNAINRASDLVARYGGEEFAIILPGMTSGEALKLAEKLIKAIQNKQLPHESSPTNDIVTISIGVAAMQADESENCTSIITAADKALYQAKERGRNKAQLYGADT